MKKIVNISQLLGVVLIFSLTSCGKFDDLNYSPNSASEPQTALLLTNVIKGMPDILTDNVPRFWIQQMTETFYTEASRYSIKNYSYSTLYSGALNDAMLIIKLNTDESTKSLPGVLAAGTNEDQIAVARILKAFYFQNITDRWGDVPYSEALNGLSAVTPKFDTQESIYLDLFRELTEASAQLGSGPLNSGDILFGGDTHMWKLLANTIRMNMALRLSKRDPEKGKEEFNKALEAGVISSQAENMYYQFLAESANQDPIYNNYEVQKRYDYSLTDVLANLLKGMSDPRMPVYADPNEDGDYVGMPYGLTTSQIAAGGYKIGTVSVPGYISLIGRKFRAQDAKVAIFTYSEVQFTIAEAYKLGWITGVPDDVNAEKSYLAGIRASMADHGVEAGDAYFQQAKVAYQPSSAVEQIVTQKWIANYMGDGYEAWSDWRRTGYPTLNPSPNPLSIDKNIPRRMAYATTERDLNGANYQEAIDRQGPDELATRVWWDKE